MSTETNTETNTKNEHVPLNNDPARQASKPAKVLGPTLIISAYGRGHWLAVELARMGLPVALMDVSEKLGSWVLEEPEGPFGIFQNEALEKSQYERLLEDEAPISEKNGFVMWLKEGPLEFKGPVTGHRTAQLGISSEVEQYLSGKTENKRKLASQSFSNNWLAQMAHSYTANEYYENASSMEAGTPANFFAPFMVRQPSRLGHQRSLDWCRRHGMQVFDKANIKDISFADRKNIRGVQYVLEKSEVTQLFSCSQMVWCLTSEETGMLSQKLREMLYPKGVLEPEWLWSRYRIKMSENPIRDGLPHHVLLVDDIDLSWTHQNFMVLLRTGSRDTFDLWCRLPNVQRFNKDYLQSRGHEILQILQQRLVNVQIEIVNYPLGFEFTYSQVGPARQPLYDPEVKQKWSAANFNNLWFDSVEQRKALGWNAQMEFEKGIAQGIKAWWDKLVAKQKKSAGVQ